MPARPASAGCSVLLLYPPSVFTPKALTGTNRPVVFQPLGLLGIAACLREAGHRVRIHDARLSGRIEERGDGTGLFGESVERLALVVEQSDADVVGISHNFPGDRPVIEELVEALKARRPQLRIVLGGHSATVLAGEYRKNPNIDSVVKGEGEHKLVALLDRLRRGAEWPPVYDGSEDKLPYFLPDLDALPLPAYDLVDMERYFHLQSAGHSPRTREYGRRAVSMFTSRGCPWECGFCSIHAVMGHRFRAHSAGYVLRHMELLARRYAIDYLHIEDDNFTLDQRRTHAILDGLLSRSLGFQWDTPNGVRADLLTRDLVFKAKASGCRYLVVGVESADEAVLNSLILKKLDLDAVEQTCRWAQQARLEMQAFFVFGYPGETLEQMRKTADFALHLYRRYDVYPNISIITPLAGTRIHDEAQATGQLVKHAGADRLHTDEFSPAQVEAIVLDVRKQVLRLFAAKSLFRPRRALAQLAVLSRNPAALGRLLAGTLPRPWRAAR